MKTVNKKIQENIKRFDLCSLIKLITKIGYTIDDIYFESNFDLSSKSSLCENIYFSEQHPKVKLIINLGLLSGNSPLPDFFRKKMDYGSIDATMFTKFLSFFDHHIIKNLLSTSMPDFNNVFPSNWQSIKSHYLKLLDLNSTSTLWHLFQVCFPELMVKIIKSPRVFKQTSSSIILGQTRLGMESFLGQKITQTIPSFNFILIGEEVLTEMNKPWPLTIKERLKTMILPILQRTLIHFRLIFIVKNAKEATRLASTSCLGYSTLGESHEALKLLLFSGYSKDLSR